MARKILGSLILSKNRRMVIEIFPSSMRKLWKEWEMRLIILLSLTCQIILILLGNRRRYTKSLLLQITLWSAYFAADSLATFALGNISSDLNDAIYTGPFDASLELEAFWAPFFLLHLGGVDTITAYSLEDNELWLRQLLSFVVQTVLVIYVLLLGWNGSHLSILSMLILVAGIINYGERTYAIWCASYQQRKVRASRGRNSSSNSERSEKKPSLVNMQMSVATRKITECLFADVFAEGISIPPNFQQAMKESFTAGNDLVQLWLPLMYESLFTKTKVSHSAWGIAMRCICFLLTCISLGLFCVLNNQEKYSKIDLSITYALLAMAVLKELYGAFVFLTSYTTLLWLGEHGVDVAPQAMKSLSSLRTPSWSNSMGQYNVTSLFLGKNAMRPHSKVVELVNYILRKDETLSQVYERPVKYYVKEGIHRYVNQAEAKYKGHQYSITRSRGRVPLEVWRNDRIRDGGDDVDPTGWLYFESEIEEMVFIWHFVTEVCYCLDYDSLTREKKDSPIYLNWKISKYLSRYLMHLKVVSSDMLRGAHKKENFYNHEDKSLRNMFRPQQNEAETSNSEEERNRHDQGKHRRRRARIQACKYFSHQMIRMEHQHWSTNELNHVKKIMKGLLIDDPYPPANESKLKRNWKLLSEVWIELLVGAANQCRGNQHAQHLRQGGELLTYVWILLGHFSLTELFVPTGYEPS